jgi:hypothetical protein
MSSMKELVEYIAKSMATEPDAVVVEERHTRNSITYRLLVAPQDMGRVIGKQGRMANAMRTLLHVAAVKEGKRVSLEIGE